MKTLRKILRVILYLILLIAIGFAGIIIYALVSDYKPEAKTEVFNSNNQKC